MVSYTAMKEKNMQRSKEWTEGAETCKYKLTQMIITPWYIGYWLYQELYENGKSSFNYHSNYCSFKFQTINEL